MYVAFPRSTATPRSRESPRRRSTRKLLRSKGTRRNAPRTWLGARIKSFSMSVLLSSRQELRHADLEELFQIGALDRSRCKPGEGQRRGQVLGVADADRRNARI